jgi:hypothetical protein
MDAGILWLFGVARKGEQWKGELFFFFFFFSLPDGWALHRIKLRKYETKDEAIIPHSFTEEDR